MDVRGQGALEYLLLIGGAVLVAAIVIALVTGVPGAVINPEAQTYCASKLQHGSCVAVDGSTLAKTFKASDGTCWSCDGKTSIGAGGATVDTFLNCGVKASVTCPTI